MNDTEIIKNKTIFIVEDNMQNRIVYQMAFGMVGAHVQFERWGHGAVNRLKLLPRVDLIILDLMLFNGISGYDLFSEIRTIPQFNTVPIIAVSAAEPSIALPKTRSLGFNGFIAKPIDDDAFPQQIAQILSGGAVWDAGERRHSAFG